jgi:hypothetical protein
MKKFIANISRITITHSKFLIMIMLLSSSGTPVKADNAFTYLKCGTRYLKLSGVNLYTTYNIRTKKFMNYYRISRYGEVMIYAEGYHLNRNTGEFGYSNGKKTVCEKIDFNELPKLNAEGKKF